MRVEDAHAAIQDEAGSGRDDAGGCAERVGHGDGVAVFVQRGNVARVLRFVDVHAVQRRLFAGAYLFREGFGVSFVRQRIERHIHEGWIADLIPLVVKGV